jgi:hypothetical protein
MTTHSGRWSTPCEVSDAALNFKGDSFPCPRTEPSRVGTVRGRCLDRLLMREDAGFMTAGTYDITAACRSPDLPEERERERASDEHQHQRAAAAISDRARRPAEDLRPEHRRSANTPKAPRAAVHGHRQREVAIHARATPMEGVAHADDSVLQRVDVGQRAAVHPYAEKPQINYTEGRPRRPLAGPASPRTAATRSRRR